MGSILVNPEADAPRVFTLAQEPGDPRGEFIALKRESRTLARVRHATLSMRGQTRCSERTTQRWSGRSHGIRRVSVAVLSPMRRSSPRSARGSIRIPGRRMPQWPRTCSSITTIIVPSRRLCSNIFRACSRSRRRVLAVVETLHARPSIPLSETARKTPAHCQRGSPPDRAVPVLFRPGTRCCVTARSASISVSLGISISPRRHAL